MPDWDDLSLWMKIQVAVMALNNWKIQTFNIHIHPDLEEAWKRDGRDPRVMMRDRLRRELDKQVRPGVEWYFVIEGWSPKSRAPTFLHIHGGAVWFEPGDDDRIMNAASRAAGHGISGYSKIDRAINGKVLTRERAGYADYLFKAARRRDDRLAERRVAMSRSLVGAAREFWNLITDR